MTPPNLICARLIRDGGIDAMAALNDALREAVVGLTSDEQQPLKLAFGRVMGQVVVEIINPAMRAFPELELDEAAWNSVAKKRAAERANVA